MYTGVEREERTTYLKVQSCAPGLFHRTGFPETSQMQSSPNFQVKLRKLGTGCSGLMTFWNNYLCEKQKCSISWCFPPVVLPFL